HGPQGYEDVALVKDRCRHTANLYSLDRELERSKEVFVKHYRQQYGMARPPIWAAAEVMSFGLLSRFYANLAVSSLRKDIAQTYDFAPDAFESLVHHIVYLRNLCAHHARLWNREFVVTVKLPRKRPAEVVSCLNPEKDRRLYNSLILLDHFANVVDPSSDWRQRLSAHLLTLPAGSLADMGFPQDQCPPFSAQQPIPSR
ncbi:MAG: Abi family protein, partial [Opitutales bacterium]